MRFFFDNCLSPHLAKALECMSYETRFGFEITHLRTKFAPNAKDQDWIAALAEEGDWVIVSADTRILTTPHLRAVWKGSGLTAFFFAPWWLGLDRWQQASKLMELWPEMVTTATNISPGNGFEVAKRKPYFNLLTP